MTKQLNIRDQAVWIMLVVITLIFSFAVENFATFGNFITILRQVAIIGILAMGMSFVLIAGGIDLSVGSTLALVGMVTALAMTTYQLPIEVAFILGLMIGIAIGAVNGIMVTITNMSPLIMTLGMSYVARGLAYMTNNGYPVYELPPSIKVIGQGYIFDTIPVPVVITAVIIILGTFVFNKTHLGRQIYALGGNSEAARLSGIAINQVRILAYMISGGLAAVAGIVMMSRVNSGQPLAGNGLEMDALIACVVGGISVQGGQGKAVGVIGGMFVMGVLANGMAIAGLSDYQQMVVKGGVLILVVAVDSYSRTGSLMGWLRQGK
ncbi:ABC transporter permease [Pseudaminobacter sp. 19-2017]|uniref:ABC transporter permease n=1 Tax=Pseudaminobacter soli (ex Zhang et al. 2022) TaxID=2831468 RepID=A0A942IC71_9HYPH|nr:ABC transporter permease [Pseudaminobacter soli]MBS3652386.1 ABC transporter permease [Pseudaminobacter soli]